MLLAVMSHSLVFNFGTLKYGKGFVWKSSYMHVSIVEGVCVVLRDLG
jgi:hypothetical protein